MITELGIVGRVFGCSTRERDNGKSLVSRRSDLQLAEDGYRVRRVLVTPRIGIVKSGERRLRYFIEGNPFVSGPKLAHHRQRNVR